jgi:hypothetical protein
MVESRRRDAAREGGMGERQHRHAVRPTGNGEDQLVLNAVFRRGMSRHPPVDLSDRPRRLRHRGPPDEPGMTKEFRHIGAEPFDRYRVRLATAHLTG